MDLYPLKFKPWLRTMVWGGEKIAKFKEIFTTINRIGESWEISAVEGHVSVVANGPLAGKSLTELMHMFKSRLVGKKVWHDTGDEFPLLIKFIDAKDDLSIQVHPGDELAARTNPGMKGKTEMWYVVGADKGAHLLSGLTQEISPEEYRCPRTPRYRSGRRILPPCRSHPRHLRRIVRSRDPADFRPDLQDL